MTAGYSPATQRHDKPELVGGVSALLEILKTERKDRAEERRLSAQELAEWKVRVAENEKREDLRIEHTSELTKAVRDLSSGQFSVRLRGQLVMQETFHGEVAATSGDTVSVSYETPDGLTEHLYHRTQFIGQRLPRVGDEVQAITRLFADRPERGSLSDILQQEDDFPFIDFSKDS